MKKLPNIHLFEANLNYYLYSVSTNSIVQIRGEIFRYLYHLINNIDDSLDQYDEETKEGIGFLQEEGFLDPFDEEVEVQHQEIDILEYITNSKMHFMILQVTQNCNLRCQYCTYSGSYVNRVHNNKRMDWDTAKKAIDFLYAHSADSSTIIIGFYGGEPVLELNLIKKSVEYANSVFKGKQILFTITTNATLLDQSSISFLKDNNFMVTVSLDGPKQIQDSNRRFVDNRGTFDCILSNLEKIKQMDEDFFNKISFNAVIDLSKDFSRTSDFFQKDIMVKDLTVTGTFVSNVSRREKLEIKVDSFIESQYEIFKGYLYHCDRSFFSHYKPTLLDSSYGRLKKSFHERITNKKNVELSKTPGGQCLPGIQRFFVNAYGDFYPCERVNENSEVMRIGNLENGFDIQKAKDILNISSITKEKCKYCWCVNLCTQCVATADGGEAFSTKKRLEECERVKKSVEEDMKTYITLRKYGCNFERED